MEDKKEVDGNSVVKYMQDASSKAQQIGRQVIYALIAIIWANIFHKGEIDPCQRNNHITNKVQPLPQIGQC